jgi:hypothetical protein
MQDNVRGSSDDRSSIWDAIKLGSLWGLCPGAILGVAYAFTPANTGLEDTLQTTAWFILFSSVAGVMLGIFIFLATKTLKFIMWALDFLGASILILLTLLTSNVVGFVGLFIIPILYILRQYIYKKSPGWIDSALDMAIPTFLAGYIGIALNFFCNNIILKTFNDILPSEFIKFLGNILT